MEEWQLLPINTNEIQVFALTQHESTRESSISYRTYTQINTNCIRTLQEMNYGYGLKYN